MGNVQQTVDRTLGTLEGSVIWRTSWRQMTVNNQMCKVSLKGGIMNNDQGGQGSLQRSDSAKTRGFWQVIMWEVIVNKHGDVVLSMDGTGAALSEYETLNT